MMKPLQLLGMIGVAGIAALAGAGESGAASWLFDGNSDSLTGLADTGPVDYTLRPDDFGALEAGDAPGTYFTKPFVFSGKRLLLNATTWDDGAIRVALLDGNGVPIRDFHLEECVPWTGDSADAPVRWQAACEMEEEAGKLRRLEFELRNARLFSFQFSDGLDSSGKPRWIGFHAAKYDDAERLLPWMPWEEALALEMEWYLECPPGKKGYPVYFYTTFMDYKYQPYRTDFIPCTQLGMGIISYLKYWEYTGRKDERVLEQAQRMGEFLFSECLTPDEGAYPRVLRSTGHHTELPIQRSAQADEPLGPNVIEPDKAALGAYALLELNRRRPNSAFLNLAVHTAQVLAENMRPGDAHHAPWPFRVDSVTGKYWGERNGNMVSVLRLFDALLALGHAEFQAPRDTLWRWIRDVQIPAPDAPESSLWIQFFEDMPREDNRNAWAPLNTARYLLERREALDPEWLDLAERCVQFAVRHFGMMRPGETAVIGEQDEDGRQWGGICSTLGGVAAMMYAAGGGEHYKEMALRNLHWATYFIDEDGGPAALWGAAGWKKGSWQEDCHTDVVHNFMDALDAVPEWRGADKMVQ